MPTKTSRLTSPYLVSSADGSELDWVTVTVQCVQGDSDETAKVQNKTEAGEIDPHSPGMHVSIN